MQYLLSYFAFSIIPGIFSLLFLTSAYAAIFLPLTYLAIRIIRVEVGFWTSIASLVLAFAIVLYFFQLTDPQADFYTQALKHPPFSQTVITVVYGLALLLFTLLAYYFLRRFAHLDVLNLPLWKALLILIITSAGAYQGLALWHNWPR